MSNVLKYHRPAEIPPEQVYAGDVLCCLGHEVFDQSGGLYVASDEFGESIFFILSQQGQESAFMTLTASQARALGRALLDLGERSA